MQSVNSSRWQCVI